MYPSLESDEEDLANKAKMKRKKNWEDTPWSPKGIRRAHASCWILGRNDYWLLIVSSQPGWCRPSPNRNDPLEKEPELHQWKRVWQQLLLNWPSRWVEREKASLLLQSFNLLKWTVWRNMDRLKKRLLFIWSRSSRSPSKGNTPKSNVLRLLWSSLPLFSRKQPHLRHLLLQSLLQT